MSSIGIGVLSHTSSLHVEAWKAEHLLAEDAKFFIGELGNEELFGEPTVAGIFVSILNIIHTLDEIGFCYA